MSHHQYLLFEITRRSYDLFQPIIIYQYFNVFWERNLHFNFVYYALDRMNSKGSTSLKVIWKKLLGWLFNLVLYMWKRWNNRIRMKKKIFFIWLDICESNLMAAGFNNCQATEAIQSLLPELCEIIYKHYLTIKLKEREALGWNLVHNELLKQPFCYSVCSLYALLLWRVLLPLL